MNGPIDAAEKAIADALKNASKDMNRGGGSSPKPNGGHLSLVGEENARRLRAAADKVADAVEDQAAERLAVAVSTVEEAKALQDTAKQHADNIRAAGEVEAQRSIEVTSRMDETSLMMEQIRQKFDQQEGP